MIHGVAAWVHDGCRCELCLRAVILWKRRQNVYDVQAAARREVQQQALALRHLGIVESIARHVRRSLPKSVLLEDLVQLGRLGLVQAAQRYNPSSAVSFECYAKKRIRGAMQDHYRRRNYDYEQHAELGPDDELSCNPDPTEAIEEAQRSAIVNKYVRQLAREDQRIVWEHVAGNTYDQIGSKRGKSTTWAFYKIRRLLKQLRGIRELKQLGTA